jgi:hypothetical protein
MSPARITLPKTPLLFPPLPRVCQGPSGTRSPAGTVLLAAFSSGGKTRIIPELVRVLRELVRFLRILVVIRGWGGGRIGWWWRGACPEDVGMNSLLSVIHNNVIYLGAKN